MSLLVAVASGVLIASTDPQPNVYTSGVNSSGVRDGGIVLVILGSAGLVAAGLLGTLSAFSCIDFGLHIHFSSCPNWFDPKAPCTEPPDPPPPPCPQREAYGIAAATTAIVGSAALIGGFVMIAMSPTQTVTVRLSPVGTSLVVTF